MGDIGISHNAFLNTLNLAININQHDELVRNRHYDNQQTHAINANTKQHGVVQQQRQEQIRYDNQQTRAINANTKQHGVVQQQRQEQIRYDNQQTRAINANTKQHEVVQQQRQE